MAGLGSAEEQGWRLLATEECSSEAMSSCVSPQLASLHYVPPHMMYVLQFLTEVFRAEPDAD